MTCDNWIYLFAAYIHSCSYSAADVRLPKHVTTCPVGAPAATEIPCGDNKNWDWSSCVFVMLIKTVDCGNTMK